MVESLQSTEQGQTFYLVTIGMPVYNAGDYLRLAVQSIIQQSFTNWELLIIDDGSTDNAFQLISDINDARIRILRDGNNKGLAVRLNECVDLARGKYFARMDQDDVSYPDRFMRQISALEKQAEIDLTAVRAITIDCDNEAIGVFPYSLSHEEICSRPWRGFHFPHPSWMGKIEWFRKYRYAEPGPYFCEDQELLLRSYRNSRLVTIDEVLFAYRIRDKVNWQKIAKTRRAIVEIQFRHFMKFREWHFLLMAVGIYFAKLLRDLLNKMSGRNLNPSRRITNDALLIEWNKVLGFLSSKSEVQ